MVSQKVEVRNLSGLHLRPAAVLCNKALEFQCSISFNYEEGTGNANAKSVLSVLGACVRRGDVIELVCEGSDEEAALKALVDCIQSGLEE